MDATLRKELDGMQRDIDHNRERHDLILKRIDIFAILFGSLVTLVILAVICVGSQTWESNTRESERMQSDFRRSMRGADKALEQLRITGMKDCLKLDTAEHRLECLRLWDPFLVPGYTVINELSHD